MNLFFVFICRCTLLYHVCFLLQTENGSHRVAAVFWYFLKRRGMAWPGSASLGQLNGWLGQKGWIGFKYIIFYACNLQNNKCTIMIWADIWECSDSYNLQKYRCALRTGQTNIPYNLQNNKYTIRIMVNI